MLTDKAFWNSKTVQGAAIWLIGSWIGPDVFGLTPWWVCHGIHAAGFVWGVIGVRDLLGRYLDVVTKR